jgi:ABC-type branched-subunit amino acid transport system substrate-binding protein
MSAFTESFGGLADLSRHASRAHKCPEVQAVPCLSAPTASDIEGPITRNKDKKESSFGEAAMFFRRRTGFAGGVLATALLLGTTIAASDEAAKKIKIGVVYDYSGPMAAGGSDLHALGTKIMIDYFNNKGGVEGYQIEPIYADAQSKPEVAINEAVRLIEQEKVDILLGFFSSAQCVPVAARADQLKKFMWITT